MTWHLVNYSDERFRSRQNHVMQYANQLGLQTLAYTREHILTTQFYQENKHILDSTRGNGYWLWKPYILLDALKKLSAGDKIIYLDCGDHFEKDLIDYIDMIFNNNQPCLISNSYKYKQNNWCKRDCFYYMNCDSDQYWYADHVEAGHLLLNVCNQSTDIISEWLEYGKDRRIITDEPNMCGLDNLSGFNDHRHDQSILTNLVTKYDLPTDKGISDRILNNHYEMQK
jgi:hypothetical protein